MQSPYFFQELLREEFQRHNREAVGKNAGSLRSFAKKIELNAGLLSHLLNGRRGLSLARAEQVADHLQLDGKRRQLFLKSIADYKTRNLHSAAERIPEQTCVLDPVLHADIIADPSYYNILNLVKTKSFKPDYDWIAKRLNLPREQVEVFVKRLMELSLIVVDSENNWQRLKPMLLTSATTEVPATKAMVESLNRESQLAKASVESLDISERELGSTTFPMDRSKLEIARQMIRKFHREMMALSELGQPEDVYLFTVRLFPVTKPISETAE